LYWEHLLLVVQMDMAHTLVVVVEDIQLPFVVGNQMKKEGNQLQLGEDKQKVKEKMKGNLIVMVVVGNQHLLEEDNLKMRVEEGNHYQLKKGMLG